MKYLNKFNYFFSGWIENLGVVPLLLFSAFLFFPDLTFLFSLLFLVTAVFETIFSAFLYLKIHKVFKSDKLLLNFLLTVKVVIVISPWCAGYSMERLVLTPGELSDLQVTDFKQFYVEDKSLLEVNETENKGKLLIRGKKRGKTTLTLVPRNKGEKKFLKVEVIIVSSSEKHFLENAKSYGLEFEYEKGKIYLDGTIRNRKIYDYIIKRIHPLQLVDLNKIKLSDELSKNLLTNLYLTFRENNIFTSYCKFHGVRVSCDIWDDVLLEKEKLKDLEKNFILTLTFVNTKKPRCAEIKIFNLSSSDEFNLNQVENYFSINMKNFSTSEFPEVFNVGGIENNIKLFHKINLNILLNKKYEINIGKTNKTTISNGIFSEGINESYFSGIKIKFEIKTSSSGLIVESTNNFIESNRSQRQTTSNSTTTSTLVKKNKTTVFINYESLLSGQSKNSLFYFLKDFLSDKISNRKNHKQLIKGTIRVNEQCE